MTDGDSVRIPVPREVKPLIEEIKLRMRPESIWLFGSRARGEAQPDSDWDLLVAVADNADPNLLDPLVGWSIQHDIGIPATILSTTTGELLDSWGAVNTLGHDLAREGRLIYG